MTMLFRTSRRISFTLIEMLTVTAIICVMVGLITVALLSAASLVVASLEEVTADIVAGLIQD